MKEREEVYVQSQKRSMAAKWQQLAEQEEAERAGGKEIAGSEAPAVASQRASALSSTGPGRGDEAEGAEGPLLPIGDSGSIARGGDVGVGEEEGGGGDGGGDGESVLKEFVDGLGPE